jgi:hypothetical protein
MPSNFIQFQSDTLLATYRSLGLGEILAQGRVVYDFRHKRRSVYYGLPHVAGAGQARNRRLRIN